MSVRKGSLGYWVLVALEKATEGVWLENFTYSGQMRSILGLPLLTKGASIAEAIRRLRIRGLIEQERNNDGKTLLRLSQIGKDFFEAKETWDGKYRIIIWDIPEKRRGIRDQLRRKLREFGFVNWQKSVWVSKKNVSCKLRRLISEMELDEYIAVIESDDPSLSHINFHDRYK